MTVLALILVFIPFFSTPPFVFTSYVQPFTLFVGWLVLLCSLHLRFSVNTLSCLLLFISYILLLKFFVFGSGLADDDVTVLIAYIVGFLQILLLFSLFRLVFSRIICGNLSIYSNVTKAFYFSILIISVSVPLQLVGPINYFLASIKPRSFWLSDSVLADSYRGLSGLLPEPSYVGTCLGILLLSSFLTGYFHFVVQQFDPSISKINNLSYRNFIDLSHYARYFKSFIASNLLSISLSILAIFLAFSPTSLLSFTFISLTIAIPFFVNFLTGFLRRDVLRYLLILLFIAFLFAIFSFNFFSQSRLSSMINIVLSGDLPELLLNDQSVADRYASSALGVSTIFNYPLGLGLNGHGYLMLQCDNQLVQSLGLMCGTIYNSYRNHNAVANLLIDGGSLFCVFVSFLLFSAARLRCFFRSVFIHSSLKFSLALLPVVILLLFVVLPAPLGSPFVWLPFSISLAFLRELPKVFVGSNDQLING